MALLFDDKVDPAMLQTAAGYPQMSAMETTFLFSEKEKEVLKGLAEKVAEIAYLPIQQEKAKLWKALNDLKPIEPLVFIDPENGWNEMITADTLVCVDPLARVWEMHLRKQIYWFTQLKDDKVIEPYFDVPYSYCDNGWGLKLEKIGGKDGGAFSIKQAIVDYSKDFEHLHFPVIEMNHEQSEKAMIIAQELFDGILKVRRKNTWWWSHGLCQEFIYLRGLEDFMCDMIAEPEYFHAVMEMLCTGHLKRLDWLEENGLLALNTEGTYIGSGGFGFTDELPTEGFDPLKVRTIDMWGFVEAQETVAVSPSMYAEFVLPYHIRIAERFGLNYYGCCEIYNTRWNYVKTIPRLRRISVSAWAEWDTVPEYLGKDYVASIKPSPAPLARKHMNEDVVRADCKRAAAQIKGANCEFIMKDNHTLGGNPLNASRWVSIMREEIDKC